MRWPKFKCASQGGSHGPGELADLRHWPFHQSSMEFWSTGKNYHSNQLTNTFRNHKFWVSLQTFKITEIIWRVQVPANYSDFSVPKPLSEPVVIFNWALRNKHQWSIKKENSRIIFHYNAFQIVFWEMSVILLKSLCVNTNSIDLNIIPNGARRRNDKWTKNAVIDQVPRTVPIAIQNTSVAWIMLCSWWRHQMETFSALLALCVGNSPVTGEFPHKGQWRGALMFSLICHLNKRLSKQSYGWWFEMPSRSLWRHCNV